MLSKYIDTERLIHSLKTAIACIIGFLLTRVVGFPADQWIVITIIVVMCAQIYVGSVIQKSYLRFLGTLTGCLFAVATILAFGESRLAIGVTLALSSFVFSYVATSQENMSYAGTLGAVTTAIIMLGQTPTTMFAAQRFLEISIGIFIAAMISQLILPIHARTHLRRAQAATLEKLRDYYTACMVTRNIDIEELHYLDLDESIVKSLSKQRALAKEASHEPLGKFYNPDQFIKTLHFEKEILRAIDFMHMALINIKNVDAMLNQSKQIHIFNDRVLQALNTLIKVIENDSIDQSHIHIPSIHTLKHDFQQDNGNSNPDNIVYVDGFLFSAETLATCLSKLANLYQLPVYLD